MGKFQKVQAKVDNNQSETEDHPIDMTTGRLRERERLDCLHHRTERVTLPEVEEDEVADQQVVAEETEEEDDRRNPLDVLVTVASEGEVDGDGTYYQDDCDRGDRLPPGQPLLLRVGLAQPPQAPEGVQQ